MIDEEIKKILLNYSLPQKNLIIAPRSIETEEGVKQFTNEVRGIYHYLFDSVEINQKILDILVHIPIGINPTLEMDESFTTYSIEGNFEPKEIILPKITSSLQSISLIGECARIMKNKNPKENYNNEIIPVFIKTISSKILKEKSKQNQDLYEVYRYFQIGNIKQILSDLHLEKKYHQWILAFFYQISLIQKYQENPKELLLEIKKVLLNKQTTEQFLSNSSFPSTEKILEYIK